MSTLAHRQWRQKAQTAVRVAVTTVKEARSRFQALSDAGDTALSDLANCLLELSHLPGLRLPEPLAAMRPDVRAAAAAKLVRRLAAQQEALQSRMEELEACVAALRGAVASLDEVPQDDLWMRCSAIFHTMPLPKVQQLLNVVYDMYRLEYDCKVAVAAAFAQLIAAPADAAAAAIADPDAYLGAQGCEVPGRSAANHQGAAVLAEMARQQGGGAAKRLPDLCTTYLSVWMLSPYLEDEQAEEALGAITEDMVSF